MGRGGSIRSLFATLLIIGSCLSNDVVTAQGSESVHDLIASARESYSAGDYPASEVAYLKALNAAEDLSTRAIIQWALAELSRKRSDRLREIMLLVEFLGNYIR